MRLAHALGVRAESRFQFSLFVSRFRRKRSMATAATTRILLIEDSNTDAVLISAHLRKADTNFAVTRVNQLKDGIAVVDRGDADVVLLDLNLPDSLGLDTFRSLHRRAVQVPIVILSGQDDVAMAVDAVSLGAQDYLPKGEATSNSLARSVRYAIERCRRQHAEQELAAAGEIQRRLFPQSAPSIDGFDIYGRCEPAESAGGDYFDYFPMLEDRYGVVVADVAGHGIGPALIMSETRAILRSLARTCPDPGDILAQANRVLAEDLHNSAFVALMLACIDPQERTLIFASAGHPGTLFDQQGRLRERIVSHDPPLGVIDDRRFATLGPIDLHSGETILFYTDGIVETFNEAEEQFGEARMMATIQATSSLSSRDAIAEIFGRVEHFGCETAYLDDRTAVVIKID